MRKWYERPASEPSSPYKVVGNPDPIVGADMSRARWRSAVVITMAVALLIVVAGTLALWLRGSYPVPQMQVYFFNSADGRLEYELRPWSAAYVTSTGATFVSPEQSVWTAISHLMELPEGSRLSRPWPDMELEEIFIQLSRRGSVVTATFPEAYMEMTPLQEALFRSAFTLTMAGIGIEEVVFHVNGQQWTESAATIANAPNVRAARLSDTQLILYFIDELGGGLVREYYDATDVDTQNRAHAALSRLIEGADTEGLTSGIPPDTRIRGIEPAIETPSLYINLSGEFVTGFSGSPAQAQLMIAAIVNTVLANPQGPRQVFFLVDWSRLETFHGVGDFMRGFEYDETVMVGFVAEEEE